MRALLPSSGEASIFFPLGFNRMKGPRFSRRTIWTVWQQVGPPPCPKPRCFSVQKERGHLQGQDGALPVTNFFPVHRGSQSLSLAHRTSDWPNPQMSPPPLRNLGGSRSRSFLPSLVHTSVPSRPPFPLVGPA